MTHLKIQADGTVRLPAKLLREARMRPGTRVAVSARPGQLSLCAEHDALARAYAAYYRGAPGSVRREQLEIEHDFAAADAEVIECRMDQPPRHREHRGEHGRTHQ